MNPLPASDRSTHRFRQSLTRRQSNLNEILASVQAGNCCRVLGPRFRHKSKLMREAVSALQKGGTHYVSYQSLTDIQVNSGSSFFANVYAGIKDGLLSQIAAGQDHPDSASEFQHALLRLVRKSDRNLALFIDDLEMAPPNLVAALLGALRAVFTTVSDQPGARFQAVVCGSLSFDQVALDSASRFETISDLVVVGDLDEEERSALARSLCHAAGLTPTDEGLQALLEQTGGDPFLIEHIADTCLEQMNLEKKTEVTKAHVVESIELFLECQPDSRVIEMLRPIESDPDLLSCALQILDQVEVASADLPIVTSETPSPLDLCGVFSRKGHHYSIKCKLWELLLRKQLTADRVGRLYAIAGYWPEAIRHLGQAIGEGQHQVKSELFTATINAMHASESALEAWGHLGQGLRVTYPDSDLRLYYREGEALRLIYPLEEQERHRLTLFENSSLEIEALHGPDYSVLSGPQGTRILLPLNLGSIDTFPIGLASFDKLIAEDSSYQQREETLQLVSFLRQAAKTVEAKGQFADLLDAAKNRADKLNALNRVLTRILRRRDRSEQTILRVVLAAGVTSGWGLGFNRAALFMPDKSQQALVGRLGVGHLTKEKAEADWETFPHQNLDELMNDLLAGQGEQTPVHHEIESLSISLGPDQDDLLVESFRTHEPIRSSRHWPQTRHLPWALVEAIQPSDEFALVPLYTGDQALGMLYVDNKFTRQAITAERFELLQSFVNQAALVLENARALEKEAALVLENARALEKEKEQTRILSELLKVEQAINDQITKSVEELLDEIVYSACQLLGADCAVLYSLRPDLAPEAYFYEIEHVACWGTSQKVTPTDKARSSEGMAAWVIREGLVHESNVKTADPSADGCKMSDSPFISRENIQAFVGVRLGPIGKPVGILYINWRSPRLLTKEELTLIQVYANFAAVAIPSARRYQQVEADLERRTQELYGMSEVLYADLVFRSEEDVEEAIKQTLQTARGLTSTHHAYLIRNESHGIWQTFWLTASGELQSERTEAIQGISRKAFVEAASYLVVNAGSPGTEELLGRRHPYSRSGLAVPVKVTGRCQAVLYLESPEPYGLNVFYQEFLEHLVSRLAFTLEQAELYQALQRLLDTSLQLTREISLETALVSVVEQAMDALRAVDAITLYYVEPESDRLVLGHMAGVHDESTVKRYPPYSRTVIDMVWASDAPIFAENVARNKLLYGQFVRQEGIKSAAAFPLEAGKERVGCMFFNYRFDHSFDKGEKSVLNLFAQWAAFAILRATLYEKAERQRQCLETVARITPIISASLESDDVLRAILREVKEAVPRAQNACLVRLDEETQKLFIEPVSLEFYRVDDSPLPGHPYQAGDTEQRGIAGRVIRTREPEIVRNVSDDPDYIPAIASTLSELCVPVIDGKTQAALVLESDELDAFTPDDQNLLKMLADHAAIAIQNADQYAELQEARDREWRERIATLATGLIHDINSASASIPGLVTEIEEKLQAESDVTAPLNDLRKSTLEAGRISNRLREFVITGQFQSKLVRLVPLIQNAIDVVQDQKPDYVTVQYQEHGSNPEIMADSLWIELLMKNLILNAFRAISDDRQGVIKIKVKMDLDHIFIQVQDNGHGIASEDISHIFRVGYTTKKDNSRLQGIGLYHCQQIAQEHQGKLEAESELGVGSTFTVTLPQVALLAISGEE